MVCMQFEKCLHVCIKELFFKIIIFVSTIKNHCKHWYKHIWQCTCKTLLFTKKPYSNKIITKVCLQAFLQTFSLCSLFLQKQWFTWKLVTIVYVAGFIIKQRRRRYFFVSVAGALLLFNKLIILGNAEVGPDILVATVSWAGSGLGGNGELG